MTTTTFTPSSSRRLGLRTGSVAMLLAALVGAGFGSLRQSDVAGSATATCSSSFQVTQQFAAGGRWDLCWEIRSGEGLVFRNVIYTPPGGTARLVMGQMNLAQIHVPYDDAWARFHDLSDYGFGSNIRTISSADCPSGSVLSNGTSPVVCKQVRNRGDEYRYGTVGRQSEELSLWANAQIGQYNYIVKVTFGDDGSITPAVGATGALQHTGSSASTGWALSSGVYGVAHFHNFYWRLDFDLGGQADDRVEELAAVASSDKQTRTITRTAYSAETSRALGPIDERTWRVFDNAITNADGHKISYELIPDGTFQYRGPTYEPFSNAELFVTNNRACEAFATHNPTTGGCAADVSAMVNGESLADTVVWYNQSFHHLPRDEDESRMHAHWSRFSLVPRDLSATNPLVGATTTTTAPPATSNDDPANATVIGALPFSRTLNTSGYTTNGDPQTWVSWSNTAWYKYTPTASGTVTISTAGSNYDTVVSVYTALALSNLVAFNDDDGSLGTSRVSLSVTAGTTYWIGVGAFGSGPGGNLTFAVTSP